jgi:predicted nucleotidyltransferase
MLLSVIMMPDLTSTWGERALGQLLGSVARAKVLAGLLLPGATPAHIRELERRCGVPYFAVHRELRLLESLGLVTAEKVGNSKRYHVSPDSPLLPGLRELVRRAAGVIPLLAEVLNRDDVDLAFVYGSVASGEDRPDSDVDVMVIGEADLSALAEVLTEVTRQTNREITPVTYRSEEFRQGLRDGNSFLSSIVRKPKLFLKGDEDALRRLGE